jgi:hypothetical protein
MALKMGIHFPRQHSTVTPMLNAFAEGMKRHSVDLELVSFPDHSQCDVAVCWNHRNHRLFKQQQHAGGHYLILEHGFIGDRIRWTSIGFDGLNGRADFVVKDMPHGRFRKHFKNLMKPWKKEGRYILVNAQCQGDASVKPYIDFRKWVKKTVLACHERFPGKEVVFRPHPVEVERACDYDVQGATTSRGKTLAEDMAGAHAVVTFNSNSGVDAVMAGVPVFAFDEGSMAWPMAAHGFNEARVWPSRIQWAADLSFKQWTVDELKRGVPWSYLKRKVM